MKLTEAQLQRYSRQTVIGDIGEDGQKKLLEAGVLIIGAGGLGSPAAMYLAAAGLGRIGIADSDRVELSNLQRQILHSTRDTGKLKAESARETMEGLNPDVRVDTYCCNVDESNIMELIAPYDFILECTDNFPTKFLINDACVHGGKPFCHGGVARFFGQLMSYVPGEGPCYRCVYKAPPPENAAPSPRQAGIVGAVAGTIGCLQAMEALKYVLGIGELLTGQLLTYDGLDVEFQKIQLEADPDCPACGKK